MSAPHPGPRPGPRPSAQGGPGGPVPHDPRQPRVTPEEVAAQVNEILSEDAEDLAAEADQLSRAHAVLHEALQ